MLRKKSSSSCGPRQSIDDPPLLRISWDLHNDHAGRAILTFRRGLHVNALADPMVSVAVAPEGNGSLTTQSKAARHPPLDLGEHPATPNSIKRSCFDRTLL